MLSMTDIRATLRVALGHDQRKSLRAATWALVAMGAVSISALVLILLKITGKIERGLADQILPALGGMFAVVTVVFFEIMKIAGERRTRARIEKVEQRFEADPKAQNAWDLARVKLESYLDRNLSQVRSIYWLTVLVMGGGLGLVAYGLVQAMNDPGRLPVSIVASASGVLISFIGGSFLIIYRSILAESRSYVSVLERINAVGMAVQVIGSIPDDSADLRHKTTADLARQLLSLYATDGMSGKSTRTSSRRVGTPSA